MARPPKKNPSTADRARERVDQVVAAKRAAAARVRNANTIAVNSKDPSAARKARIERQAAADRVHQLAAGERQWRDKARRMGWKDSELADGRLRRGGSGRSDSTPPPATTSGTSGTGGSGGSGGSGTGGAGGKKTVPGPKAPPSLKRDKNTAKKNTALARALKTYGDPKSDPSKTGEMVSPGGPWGTDLSKAEYAKFKTGFLKDHKKAYANVSDASLRMLARHFKHKNNTGWKKYGGA